MNPNTTAIAAPRLINDVAPPYADALPAQNHTAAEVAEIPVKQEASHDQPMFPVANPLNPPQPVEPVQAQAPKTPDANFKQIDRKNHDKAKINWVIIVTAVSVSVGLAYLALMAFKTTN